MKKFDAKQPVRYTILISCGYFVIASCYILASGKLAAHFATSKENLEKLEMYKGLGFMFFSSLGLFTFCYILFHKIFRAGQQIYKDREALILSERKASSGVLASCMAHDANNVLSIISLRLEQLLLQIDPQHRDVQQTVTHLRVSTDRLISMMEKLKRAGTSGLGKIEVINFDTIIRECVDMAEHHHAFDQCTISTEITNTDVDFKGYPTLIHQMLLNLLINAAEAAKSKQGQPHVHVKLTWDEKYIRLSIGDNGPGITPDVAEKIFDAFYTTKSHGTGLGLLSVKACLDEHRGELQVTRSHLGGASFDLTFPRPPAELV